MRAPGVAQQVLQAYFLDCIRRYADSQELLMTAVHPPHSAPIAVTDCRDLTASSELETAPAATASAPAGDGPRRLAAGAAGAVLVAVGVAGLHHLQRAGHGGGAWVVWVAVLLAWLTALGGGIKLATWGLRPVIDAAFDAGKQRLSEAAQATIAALGIVFGAVGLWWTLRGGYTQWWQSISGEPGWSLTLGVGQMAVAVFAGAALFTGGKYLAGLAGEVLADAGLIRTTEAKDAGVQRNPDSGTDTPLHPVLVGALIVGALALVAMTVWLTPMLAPTIIGTNTLAAAAAIAAVLVWGVGANLGWWKGLEGLYQWATAASQKASATAGVVAVLMFSAGGLGLGWFTPATVPQAHAQCPPDCGGGSNGSNSYGPDASQFQPPQMQSQLPDYQSGGNQAPMDQNSSVSIYNTQAPSVSQNTGSSQGAQQPQQGWDQPAHGTQIPDYQTATPYTQGPGAPNPEYNGGQSSPGTNAGSQGGQANQGAPQQQGPQQPPANQSQPAQQQPGQQPQQPGQQQPDQQQQIDDLTKQLQDQQQQSTQDRQKLDDLTKQLQNQQGQQQKSGNQKLPKAPSKDKKQDEKNQQDQNDQSGNNDLSALLLGAASTRRRKQDEQGQPQQGQQSQGPDTQALAQDGAQMGQSLPGDITNTVSDSVNLGQSAGSAAQNFGSAAQAGASLASSAQSGAVNPMDAVALVQGISGGISDTADAVNSGTSIASTWLNEVGQGAQLAADANPQLEPQMQQVQQLTQAGSQVADLTGQVASGVSQVSGLVNTATSLGASGMPDPSGASDLAGTATNASADASQLRSVDLQSGSASAATGSPVPAAAPLDKAPGDSTDGGDETPPSLSDPTFVGILVGRNARNKTTQQGGDEAMPQNGITLVDEFIPTQDGRWVGADGIPGAIPFQGEINYGATGNDLANLTGQTKSGVVKPVEDGYDRVHARSAFNLNGQPIALGVDMRGGGDGEDFQPGYLLAWNMASGDRHVLTRDATLDAATAFQDPKTGITYFIGGAGAGDKHMWMIPKGADFFDHGSWQQVDNWAIPSTGRPEQTLTRVLDHAGNPVWVLYETGSGAGITYRAARTPEGLSAAAPTTLLDTSSIGGFSGLAPGQERPGLPGIPLDDGKLPDGYNVGVHQLPNGDLVLFVSQWLHQDGMDWTKEIYRVVQYKQTVG
ncbi:Uncharacterised protein [Mycobacteroides abscessus subsp. massiliense]|nr:Uncharacterised protein [Mycobacteroides abscessus subsp. massiliense]